MKTYKGVQIERIFHNGYYSALTKNGYVLADNLKGIKKLIKERD